MSRPTSSSYSSSGGTPASNGDELPVSSALRIVMGIGFLAIGLVQGVGIMTAGELAGLEAIIDGIGFFLLAGTGVTMLMDRFYSLYLLLLWAILGIVGSFTGGGTALPALFARIMVALVAMVAIGQKSAAKRGSTAYR